MIETELQRKFEDFRELGIPKYVTRKGEINLVDRMVTTIVGARRAGKSFRSLQLADELIRNGTLDSIQQVCHLDFDNPILSAMTARDLSQIQDTFLKISPGLGPKTPLVFILDEIHKIKNWEEYVIDLSRNPNWKVVVTGSSSKMIKTDMATELRGKAVSSTIHPLSFVEFLEFRSFKGRSGSSKGQAEIRRHFDDYLKWGSYPALVNLEQHSKEALLREYFDTMILRDIIQRYNVSKPRQCIQLYNYLLSNIGKPHTLRSAYGYLKEGGYTTSRDSVHNYIDQAEDSWLLFLIPIQSDSHKEQDRNYKKIYAVDWALAIRNSSIWDGFYSRALENMIFMNLHGSYPRIRYYLTRSKRQEVDFIASDSRGKPVLAVQVCMDLSQKNTLDRELEPLIATAKYFNIKENLIITLNEEKKFQKDQVTVNAIPAWKWFLKNEGPV